MTKPLSIDLRERLIHRLGVVLGNTFAEVVHDAEVELDLCITPLGKWLKLLQCGGVILSQICRQTINKIRPCGRSGSVYQCGSQ